MYEGGLPCGESSRRPRAQFLPEDPSLLPRARTTAATERLRLLLALQLLLVELELVTLENVPSEERSKWRLAFLFVILPFADAYWISGSGDTSLTRN